MHGWAGTVGAGTRAGQNVTLRNTESIIAAAPSRLCRTVYELHRMPREAVAGQKRTNSRMPNSRMPAAADTVAWTARTAHTAQHARTRLQAAGDVGPRDFGDVHI